MTIMKLTTFICKLLLQIASYLLLVEVTDLLLVKYGFLNILGRCLNRMKNYLLGNIIAEVGSRSPPISNRELSVTIVNI